MKTNILTRIRRGVLEIPSALKRVVGLILSQMYLIKRVGQAVFTLFVVITGTFFLIRLIPGGPIDFLRAQLAQRAAQSGGNFDLSAADLMEQYTNINPDRPLYLQYVDYMSSMMTGDLGQSLWYNEPVYSIIADAAPWTVFVMTLALMASFLSGILIGGFMAYWEGSRFDTGMTMTNILSTSIPYYVFALLLLGTLGYEMRLLPLGGRYDPNTTPGFNVDFMVGAVKHALLPFISIQIATFGGPALAMRGNSIQVLGSDYLRVARLRGLSQSRIATRYVVRNAVLPLYTQFMIGIASVFAGSVILEEIFAYPGLGYYLVRSFEARDYPLMMATFVLLAGVTIIGILIADLTYGSIDPRIRMGEEHESF